MSYTSSSKSSSKKQDVQVDVKDLHSFTDTHGIITSTMNDLPGYRVTKVLGTVYGLNVKSRNIGADIVSGLKSLVGGELPLLTKLLYTSRNDATERMLQEAQSRGGNAVIAMRFDIAEISNGFSQVGAYGTACVVEPIE